MLGGLSHKKCAVLIRTAHFGFNLSLRSRTCLCHDFFSEVVLSLLDAFAGLETYEIFDDDLRAVRLADLIEVLAYSLLAVLSADIDLVKKADLFELLVQSAFSCSL